MATGAVDPIKRRIVSSTRFTSRAGAERQLYTSSLPLDLGKTSEQLAHKTTTASSAKKTNIASVSGAWAANKDELAAPSRNPMAMVLDHESVVVGCADGCIYRIHFVGSQYEEIASDRKHFMPVQQPLKDTDKGPPVGDATINNLLQLRHVWSDIFVPANAHNHPGRLRT